MKRFAAIMLLATIFVFFSIPATANKSDYVVEDFNDIVSNSGAGHWAFNEMSELISMGILKGYNGGTVYDDNLGQEVPVQLAKPDRKITRAEFAVLLSEVLNLQPGEATVAFNDQIPSWAKDAVNALSKAGIIRGNPDGTFRPDDNISRAEIAAMIVQSVNDKSEKAGKYFPDVRSRESHWAYDFIQKASSMGIIKGQPNGKFAPNRSALRAEVAVMLYQFMLKDRSQAPEDGRLLTRTDNMLKAIEASINNNPGAVELSSALPYLTGREEAILADSAKTINDMKQRVSLSYRVTYPGTVVDKSDRWAEVVYQSLITVSAGDKKSERRSREHYYLMKIGDEWYIYSDMIEDL